MTWSDAIAKVRLFALDIRAGYLGMPLWAQALGNVLMKAVGIILGAILFFVVMLVYTRLFVILLLLSVIGVMVSIAWDQEHTKLKRYKEERDRAEKRRVLREAADEVRAKYNLPPRRP